MKISELQAIFLSQLEKHLEDWKFIKGQREFKKVNGNITWYFHISCINHVGDFDGVGDVAIEFKKGKERICIIGAELGNIEGQGQKRFKVSNRKDAKSSAASICELFLRVGLPFLQKYSDPYRVISTLENGGEEAMLISPFADLRPGKLQSMKRQYQDGI